MNGKTKSELLQEFELSEHTTEFHLLEQGYRTAEAPLLTIISDKDKRIEELEEIRDDYAILCEDIYSLGVYSSPNLMLRGLREITERIRNNDVRKKWIEIQDEVFNRKNQQISDLKAEIERLKSEKQPPF